jgi:hypothetical protein
MLVVSYEFSLPRHRCFAESAEVFLAPLSVFSPRLGGKILHNFHNRQLELIHQLS